VSAEASRIAEVCRDLVVDEGFAPLDKVLPAAGGAAGLFDACVARLDSGSAPVHAFLAWRGQDPSDLSARGEALRRALELGSRGLSQRVAATLFIAAATPSQREEALAALAPLKQGHFLEKVQLSGAAVDLATGTLSHFGRRKPEPGLDWFEQHFVSGSAHLAEAGDSALERMERDEARARSLLSRGDTWATWGLIALNAAVFLAQYAYPQMESLGANESGMVFAGHQPWRLLTSMFLHAGELHLFFNMASLFSLGTLVERLSGPGKFLLIYFAAGLLGSLFSALNPEGIASVGASGAIFGLAGALVALKFRRPKAFPAGLAGRIFSSLVGPIALTFGLGLMLNLSSGPVRLDNWAHFGGLFAGFGLAWLWPSLMQKPLRGRPRM
jgi:membrane associated rhomboid family serine protease